MSPSRSLMDLARQRAQAQAAAASTPQPVPALRPELQPAGLYVPPDWQWQYAKPGPYVTPLNSQQETQFQQWVRQNNVPFDPSPTSDYDMRGFWLAGQQGDPRAVTQINPNDNRIHFNDAWKTPYHMSFSNQSIYAQPNAPQWNHKDQLIDPYGNVVFDEPAYTQRQREQQGIERQVNQVGGGLGG